MGETKAMKGGYKIRDDPSRVVSSSGRDNKANFEVFSSCPIQEAKCSAMSKDVFHLSDNSDVQILGEEQVEGWEGERNDKLGDAKFIFPLSQINVPKVNELLGSLNGWTEAEVVLDNPKAEDINIVPNEPSARSYESIDSTSDNIVGVGFLRNKHVTELVDKHRESSLGVYAS